MPYVWHWHLPLCIYIKHLSTLCSVTVYVHFVLLLSIYIWFCYRVSCIYVCMFCIFGQHVWKCFGLVLIDFKKHTKLSQLEMTQTVKQVWWTSLSVSAYYQVHFMWIPFCLEGEEFVQSVYWATSYWGARAIVVLFSSFLLPILSLHLLLDGPCVLRALLLSRRKRSM